MKPGLPAVAAALLAVGLSAQGENDPVVLASTEVLESSGIAFSQRRPGVLWTHNDSGDMPRLFAFDAAGRDLGTFTVEGATHADWEDLCSVTIAGVPCLVIGDTGDNSRDRANVRLYVVEEPATGPSKGSRPASARVTQAITFTYEDGPRNCEALAAAPDGRTFYLASKDKKSRGKLYELERPEGAGSTTVVARIVAPLALPKVTAMDMSRDGLRAIMLTYMDAYEFRRSAGETWRQAFARDPRRVPLPPRDKGESVCYGPDGRDLYLTSEGSPCPLWRVAAPD